MLLNHHCKFAQENAIQNEYKLIREINFFLSCEVPVIYYFLDSCLMIVKIFIFILLNKVSTFFFPLTNKLYPLLAKLSSRICNYLKANDCHIIKPAIQISLRKHHSK